ncbi:MAG TPA: hypothetical protein VFE30_09795 [Anaeromyxobacteraceae bacterium]|jgi:hypothetical protein|nr:hypothetical protein [Anaeromyxobacteraceae bacterium]
MADLRQLVRELHRLWGRAAAARVLRRCELVGEGVVVRGDVQVKKQGRIDIGAGVEIVGTPAPTHLVTGVAGLLRIAPEVHVSEGVGIAAYHRIDIGERTWVGPFTTIVDANFEAVARTDARPFARRIIIGRDVKIGEGAIIQPGARIGDGAEIAAHAVISGTIPARALAVGASERDDAPVGPRSREVTSGVVDLIRRTFELRTSPALSDGPSEIPQWDPVGSRLLLAAIEAEFGLQVRQLGGEGLTSVGAVVESVELALWSAPLAERGGVFPC